MIWKQIKVKGQKAFLGKSELNTHAFELEEFNYKQNLDTATNINNFCVTLEPRSFLPLQQSTSSATLNKLKMCELNFWQRHYNEVSNNMTDFSRWHIHTIIALYLFPTFLQHIKTFSELSCDHEWKRKKK